jgi:hypothetical protein
MENKILILLLAGFVLLTQINPQVVSEFDVLALSYYNLEGMDGQLVAKWMIYLGAGIASMTALIGLSIRHKKSIQVVIGLSFLTVSSLIWISFGLISLTPEDFDNDSKLLLMRTIIFMLTSIIGFLLLGTSYMKLRKKVILKHLTLTIALAVGTLGALSTFVFNDETYFRTNSSLALYFIWIGLVGTLMLTEKKSANKTYE